MFGSLRANPRIFSIVHVKHTHTGYPETLLLAYLVQKYGCLWRGVKPPQLLALCISNTPILGIQKHCCWLFWCRGTCVSGTGFKFTTFDIVHIKHTYTRYPGTLMLAYLLQRYGCLGCHSRTQTIFFGMVYFKHPHPRYPKKPFLAWCAEVWVLGVPPQKPNNMFLALCSSNTPILGIQKHLCWPMGYNGMGVRGATPEARQFFWHCAFQTPPS